MCFAKWVARFSSITCLVTVAWLNGAGGGPRTDLYGDVLPAGAIARMGTVRFRHGGSVTFLAFMPDGKRCVTTSMDETLCLWEVPSGRLLHKTSIRGIASSHCALAPDGKVLAQTEGPCVILREATTGRVLRLIQAADKARESGWTNLLRFSPDSKTLATAGNNETLQVWEVGSGRERWKVAGRKDCLFSTFAFSHDGKIIVAHSTPDETGERSKLRSWNVQTGKESQLASGFAYSEGAVAFSPDDKVLAYGREGQIVLFDMARRKETVWKAPERTHYVRMQFTPNGNELIALTKIPDNGHLHAYDVASTNLVRRIDTGHPLQCFALSKDGKSILVGDSGGRVRAADAASWALRPLDRAPLSFAYDLAFTPDGETLLTAGHGEGRARLWQAATGKEIRQISQAIALAVDVSPDGGMAALCDEDMVTVIDMKTGKTREKLEGTGAPFLQAVFSPDGKSIATTDKAGARWWDRKTGKQNREFRVPARVRAAAFGGRSKRVALLCEAPEVARSYVELRLWDGDALRELARRRLPSLSQAGLAFSGNGRFLAVKAKGGIHLLDGTTGTTIRVLKCSTSEHLAVAFSPDGRLLAAGDTQDRLGLVEPEHSLRLWDTGTGKEVSGLAPGGQVTGLVFSANGKRIASGLVEGSVLVWDVDAGRKRRRDGPPKGTMEK